MCEQLVLSVCKMHLIIVYSEMKKVTMFFYIWTWDFRFHYHNLETLRHTSNVHTHWGVVCSPFQKKPEIILNAYTRFPKWVLAFSNSQAYAGFPVPPCREREREKLGVFAFRCVSDDLSLCCKQGSSKGTIPNWRGITKDCPILQTCVFCLTNLLCAPSLCCGLCMLDIVVF